MEKRKQVDLSSMAEHWGSGVVAREKIEEFTGGVIKPKTLANLDSEGKGPNGAIRIGRKILYPVTEVIAWLETRATARAAGV